MAETTAVVEKSLRSVFVGNIPYEATEDKLREIFSQVGPVVSFKLMHDRESGKPKGYGFCEYKDQETALSAMRNLNAFEIGGRPLRVDNACTEKSRMEMQSLMTGPVIESPYGPDVEPGQAPEAISNAVASLPPEQMFELMRQMQVCVRSNRTEARTMLLNNPQLAYALLQAQVVMRIIDPKTAVQLLHGETGAVLPMTTGALKIEPHTNGNVKPPPGLSLGTGSTSNGPSSIPSSGMSPSPMGSQRFGPPPPSQAPPMPQQHQAPPHMPRPPHHSGPPHHQGPAPPHHGPPQNMGGMQGPPPGPPPPSGTGAPPPHFPPSGGDFDLRGPPPRGSDQDMRMPPSQPPHGPPNRDYPPPHHQDFDSRFPRDSRGPAGDFDQRDPRYRDQPPFPPRDNRSGRGGDRMDHRESRGGAEGGRERPVDAPDRDYRGGAPDQAARDPRARGPPPSHPEEFPRGGSGPGSSGPAPPVGLPSNLTTGLAGHDQEKASLIMQVLQLSDEQIRMLPPEQQASILQLKEQIQQSQH